jgi:Fur family transcriptional regulator, ferric uptake regulator
VTRAPERSPLEFDDIEDVMAAMRGAGHRVSAPTRAVLEALFESDDAVTAEQITERPGQRLELTSVYRNLERLERLGVVAHVHAGHGAGLYSLTNRPEREYQVCERCGRVEAVNPAVLNPLRDALEADSGFRARFTHFPLHGHCAACVKQLQR